MVQRYLIAGAFGVVLTVAFYEGRSALKERSLRAAPSRSTETASRGRGCDGSESACQDLVDSLMRCQERLARRESETPQFASISEEQPAELLGPPPPHDGDRFDPDPDEWKELADQGRVKLSRPCAMTEEWRPSEAELRSVGLEPNDAQAVVDAYKSAASRAWEATRGHCAEWLGVDARVAERIGSATCESILDVAAQKDEKAFRRVAEVRAGRRAEDSLSPVERYYVAKTKELKEFESDLAKRVGSEATRRITESTTFCTNRELWPELAQ